MGVPPLALASASGGSGHAQRLVGDALGAARQGDAAGADQLADAVRLQQLQHGGDLVGAAGWLDGERVGRDVHHLGAEQLRQLHHLVAQGRVGADLDQDQLALDRARRLQLDDLEDVDELVELLGDLLQGPVRAVDDDRHAAGGGVLGGPDCQRVDVEAAAAEQAGDAGQHAGLVGDQHRDRVGAHRARTSRLVAAACSSAENSGPRMISSLERPAGTIGKTPSWASTRKSTTAGTSPTASAFSRVASTSSGRSTLAPIAAGTAKPMVPRPPELIHERGRLKRRCWAAYIWCWPTPATTTACPPVSSATRSTTYCGFSGPSARWS